LRQRIDSLAFACLRYLTQKIAHRLNPRDRFLCQLHPARLRDFECQTQPLERIDAEIELRACVGSQSLAWIAARQHFPAGLRSGIFQYGTILA
jgi:hypothetical protein